MEKAKTKWLDKSSRDVEIDNGGAKMSKKEEVEKLFEDIQDEYFFETILAFAEVILKHTKKVAD